MWEIKPHNNKAPAWVRSASIKQTQWRQRYKKRSQMWLNFTHMYICSCSNTSDFFSLLIHFRRQLTHPLRQFSDFFQMDWSNNIKTVNNHIWSSRSEMICNVTLFSWRPERFISLEWEQQMRWQAQPQAVWLHDLLTIDSQKTFSAITDTTITAIITCRPTPQVTAETPKGVGCLPKHYIMMLVLHGLVFRGSFVQLWCRWWCPNALCGRLL